MGIPYLWSLLAYPIADLEKRNTKKSDKKEALRSDSFFSIDTNVEVPEETCQPTQLTAFFCQGGEDENEEEQGIRILQIQVVLQKLLTHITASLDEFPL